MCELHSVPQDLPTLNVELGQNTIKTTYLKNLHHLVPTGFSGLKYNAKLIFTPMEQSKFKITKSKATNMLKIALAPFYLNLRLGVS